MGDGGLTCSSLDQRVCRTMAGTEGRTGAVHRDGWRARWARQRGATEKLDAMGRRQQGRWSRDGTSLDFFFGQGAGKQGARPWRCWGMGAAGEGTRRRELGVRAEGTCRPGLQSSNGCSVEEQRLEQKGRHSRRGATDDPGAEASRHGRKSSCWERLPQGNSVEEASAAGAQGEGAVWSLGRRPWGREEPLLACYVEGRVEGDAGSVRRLKEKRKMVVAAVVFPGVGVQKCLHLQGEGPYL